MERLTGPIGQILQNRHKNCRRHFQSLVHFLFLEWSNLAGFLNFPRILTFLILAVAAFLLLYRQDLRQNSLKNPWSVDCLDSSQQFSICACLWQTSGIERLLIIETLMLMGF